MKVLIIIKKPNTRYLVRLHNDDLIERVKENVRRRELSLAIKLILTEGVEVVPIIGDEIFSTDADLILAEDSVRWDLT